MSFDYYIARASSITSVLLFAAALIFCRKGFKNGYGWLIIFFVFNGVQDLLLSVLGLFKINNWVFIYLTAPVYFFIAAYVLRLFETEFNKELKFVTWCITLQIVILHSTYIISNEPLQTAGLLLQSLALSFLSLRILIAAKDLPKAFNLFAIGIFLYSSVSSVSFYALMSYKDFYPAPYIVNCGANVLANIIFLGAVWEMRR